MKTRWWLALLWGCNDGSPSSERERPDGGVVVVDAAFPDAAANGAPTEEMNAGLLEGRGAAHGCEPPWLATPQGECLPPPLRVDCPEGTFPLPSGSCSEPWVCPEGWVRSASGACEPQWPACDEGQLPHPNGDC